MCTQIKPTNQQNSIGIGYGCDFSNLMGTDTGMGMGMGADFQNGYGAGTTPHGRTHLVAISTWVGVQLVSYAT